MVEPLVLAQVARHVGLPLGPMKLPFGDASRVEVDGGAADFSIFVEVFAHQGSLRGGQVHKVARDALKLITLRRFHADARLILAFADSGAVTGVLGDAWLAEALRLWGVEVFVADLDDETRALLVSAQRRQYR
ncbi:MAG TPA: hypothetical protein DCQ04_08355 [Actinobacteria bacterium]|nr:hypothetical protein [Actinomycetota bacterium]